MQLLHSLHIIKIRHEGTRFQIFKARISNQFLDVLLSSAF